MVKMVDIYFNELLHKYTDNESRPYISVTTVIHKYINPFDTNLHAERVAKRTGKTKEQVIAEWNLINKQACEKGSATHELLENSINDSNNFVKNTGKSNEYVKMYSISSIMKNHDYGKLDVEKFSQTKLALKYPKIMNSINHYSNKGFYIYAEIAVYDTRCLICGMIDVLLVNWETKEFIILDWKTNNKPLMFKSGYFKKDILGYWSHFVQKDEKMKYPFNTMPDCAGSHYTLQLSLYAALIEQFGLKQLKLVLCHIYNNKKTSSEEINFYPIEYKKILIDKLIRNRINQLKKEKQND